LGLHRNVESAGGVVGDHQLGRAGKRDGDHDALRHAAAQLVWKGAEPPLGVGNVHGAQHLKRPSVGLGPTDAKMVINDIRDLAADRQDRVELGAWIGDDHRQLSAQDGAAGLVVETRQVAAVEQHAAALDDARRRHQPHGGAGQRRLAGSRFAHQADELAGRNAEVDTLERPHRLGAVGGEAHPKIGDLEDPGCVHRRLSSAAADRGRNRSGRRPGRSPATGRPRRGRIPGPD